MSIDAAYLSYRLNDVVATGPESFYTTRYFYSRTSPLVNTIAMFTGLPLGAVFHHDGKKTRIVESGLGSPNGINVSPDGK